MIDPKTLERAKHILENRYPGKSLIEATYIAKIAARVIEDEIREIKNDLLKLRYLLDEKAEEFNEVIRAYELFEKVLKEEFE